MRMQMTPSSALGHVEPVVFAPKAGGYVFRQEELRRESSPANVTAHPAVVHHPAETMATPTPTPTPTQPTLDEATAARAVSGKRDVFVCPEVHCGKQFPRSFALRRHLRIHTGNKPYPCEHPGCSQRFNTSGNLSRHKRIHSGERPYPCVFETCGKRFNTSTKLKRHMKIHFPDGQNLFHCVAPACSWACDNYKEYVQHQKLHRSVAGAGAAAALHDENVDRSNASRPASRRAKASKAAARAASPLQPQTQFQPRHVDFPGSPRGLELHDQHSAQHLAAPANDEYYAPQDRSRAYSGLAGAPSALMMMHKDAPQPEESEYRRLGGGRASYLDEPRAQQAPRLPFPTRAFPSESIASAMPSSGLLGGSFHHLTHYPAASQRSSYFDPAVAVSSAAEDAGQTPSSFASTPAYPSFLRGDVTYQSTATTSSYMTTSEPYAPSQRHEHASRGYDSPEAAGASPQQDADAHSRHAQQFAAGSGSGLHHVPPELTGEELSAVLELMKDS